MTGRSAGPGLPELEAEGGGVLSATLKCNAVKFTQRRSIAYGTEGATVTWRRDFEIRRLQLLPGVFLTGSLPPAGRNPRRVRVQQPSGAVEMSRRDQFPSVASTARSPAADELVKKSNSLHCSPSAQCSAVQCWPPGSLPLVPGRARALHCIHRSLSCCNPFAKNLTEGQELPSVAIDLHISSSPQAGPPQHRDFHPGTSLLTQRYDYL
ncbi:hypothetical protein B0T20DRAFT_262133 [Sordaria brevicollis]|uniref:Uncharacterized protein n=1 Tax=Sordaria brevicollis TaxID=83679 RepID=A0AAE0PAF6_SORBR|nr:hypothetical protein B0T20DRAFT_262133 [Sordaria brevicollis]